jgi:hypothetical protein
MTDQQEKQNHRREDIKDAMKEAMREWLDDKFAEVGRWGLKSLAALAIVALLWLILVTHGWKPPQQ